MDHPEETHFRSMPGWYWPDDVPNDEASSSGADIPRTGSRPSASSSTYGAGSQAGQGAGSSQRRTRTHWPPRQCRICLEMVQPTTHVPSEHIPGFMQQPPKVTYEDEDGGRLLRPCHCKGTQKYVHENCLQAWRHADPGNRRNFWQCPTCGYKYRLARLGWGKWVASTPVQIAMTIMIMFTVVFFLGFVADPIINLYIDPWSYLSPFSWGSSYPDYYYADEEPASWAFHFAKGMAGLGVVGFLKTLVASPFHFIRFGGGRRRGRVTGRDRVEQVSWLVIAIGVLTVMSGIYKGVKAYSKRALQAAGERVMDVQNDDDDEDDD